MKLILITLITSLSTVLSTPAKAAEPCHLYTVDTPGEGYGYAEVNNCPVLKGTFSNNNWRVTIGGYEPGDYYYRGVNRNNDSSIELIDSDVRGTTDRPQYRFHNGNVTYSVTFRYSDPNTIRLQVYQGNREILNQLLYR